MTEFASSDGRFKTIKLKWPVIHDGVAVDEIGLARLTAREVAVFQERVAKSEGGARAVWPMFRLKDGAPVPGEVLDSLDDDDRYELDRAALDFLPQRFRNVLNEVSGRPAGEPIAPSQPA